MIKEQRFVERIFYIISTPKLYHFSESYIKAISFWKMKATDHRKIWNSYITFLYLGISILQKALSQCYTLPDIGISRYCNRLIFLLMVFCYRKISQTCLFLPQEKFPVKPSALESEIHPSHKSKICTLCISPCRGQIHAGVNYKC